MPPKGGRKQKMKANRKFVQADEAVSPVIAVILMVAITVVLAATVFVLVSDIGGNTGSAAPSISWAPDESNDRLGVTTASNNADWFRLTVQVDSCTVSTSTATVVYAGATPATSIAKNTDATTSGAPLNTGTAGTVCGATLAKRVGTTSAKMVAGDYIDICHGPVSATPPTVTSVKVIVKDTTANSVVLTHTFTDLANCAA
jgi:archaeal type IV pilus assembly protein PilA